MTFRVSSALIVLARAQQPSRTETVWYTVLTVSAFAGALLLAAAVIAWASRWRKRQMEGPTDSLTTLASFQEAYQNGELTRKEYERIRDRLSGKPAPPGPSPPGPPTVE